MIVYQHSICIYIIPILVRHEQMYNMYFLIADTVSHKPIKAFKSPLSKPMMEGFQLLPIIDS